MQLSKPMPDQVPGGGRGPDGPVWPTSGAVGRLQPLGLGEVVLAEPSELGHWQVRNSTRTLPHCIQQVRASGALGNLRRVAEGALDGMRHEGMLFSDSDIYKVIEAAAWDSVRGVSPSVAEFVEEATAVISRAQRDDGYINSWVQGDHPELAWKELRFGHELYCAGHLLQAAVASHRTGSGAGLSAVSNRLLQHLLRTFSLDDGDGRLVGICGHPGVETALVEYYRVTGDSLALKLATRQVDLRGRADVDLPTTGVAYDNRFPLSYFLHHVPVRQRATATGHAVRELYLQAGVVDVAVETQDRELLWASEAIWEDLYDSKTFVTGAHGSRHQDESIGDAYELPSDRAYGETCAAIASFQWNWRLLLATGRARYAEAMERVFWNTIAGAVSREGTEFFYSNALHLRTDHDSAGGDSSLRRLPWYQCACCPPNLARLMATIQAYVLTRDASGVQVQMPFSGRASTCVPGGTVKLALETGHPWEGTTRIEVTECSSTAPWRLSLRSPEWARSENTRVVLNGRTCDTSRDGSYVSVSRQWRGGDRLEMEQAVPIRVLSPHWRIDAVRECVALQRGPLVYCLEAADLEDGHAIEDVALSSTSAFSPSEPPPKDLEEYVKIAIVAPGEILEGPVRPLYDGNGERQVSRRPLRLTFVPYFARGNRSRIPMRVWVPSHLQEEKNQSSPNDNEA